jgi:hypothetical protein
MAGSNGNQLQPYGCDPQASGVRCYIKTLPLQRLVRRRFMRLSHGLKVQSIPWLRARVAKECQSEEIQPSAGKRRE